MSADILALARRIRPRAARHPLDDPRLALHVEDGRYFLQTTERRFDLITGEPPPPIMAGVVSLYTAEYFALMRSRLAPGGIASYWLPIMNLSAATTKSLVRGFCQAFADCSLWQGSGRNFMLLGTHDAGRAGPVSAERFARAFADPAQQDELRAIGVEQPAQLGALFVGDAEYLRELTADSRAADRRPADAHAPARHARGARRARVAVARHHRGACTLRAQRADRAPLPRVGPHGGAAPVREPAPAQRPAVPGRDGGPPDARGAPGAARHAAQAAGAAALARDPDIQRSLARAPVQVREQPEWSMHRAAGALAERDYPAALELLTRTPDEQLPLPDLREYVRYVISRGAQGN